MDKIIYINGIKLTNKEIFGVHRYTYEILRELDKIITRGSIVVLVPQKVDRELNFNNYLLVSSYKSQIDGLISYERSALIAMDKTFRSASNIIGYIIRDWGISPEVAYSILISLAAQNEPLIEFNVSSPEKLSFRETKCRLTDKGSVLSDAIKQCMKVKNWERKDVSDRG